MRKPSLTGQRLAALFLLGFLLLNYPLLSLSSGNQTWLGIPVLYLYIFGIWTALIMLIALVIERGKS
jgi:hypothetical protein